MAFRNIFIAILIAFVLLAGAFLLHHARPNADLAQPNVEFVKASGKCAECHSRQQYSIVHKYTDHVWAMPPWT